MKPVRGRSNYSGNPQKVGRKEGTYTKSNPSEFMMMMMMMMMLM
jgi:hypothetical protein